MPQVLELPHLVEHHRVAQVDVGRRGIEPQLDAQRLAAAFGLGELAHPVVLGQQLVAATPRDLQRMRYLRSDFQLLVFADIGGVHKKILKRGRSLGTPAG